MIQVGDGLDGRWFTLDEACQAAHISRRTLNRWIRSGQITVLAGHVNAARLADVERERWRTRRRRGPSLPDLTYVS